MQPTSVGGGPDGDDTGSPPRRSDTDLTRRLIDAEAALETLQLRIDSNERLAAAVAYQHAELRLAEARLADLQAELVRAKGRRVVRYADRLRRLANAPRRLARRVRPSAPAAAGAETEPLVEPSSRFYDDVRYETWLALHDTFDDVDRFLLRSRLDTLADPPLISVILPTFNTPEPYLRSAIESVQAQVYEHWELCVVDDASTDPRVHEVLAEYASTDRRIRVEHRPVNGHISAASNSALAMASGEWLALFDHDDLMAEHALGVAVLALASRPGAGLLYSDEDHLFDDGRRDSAYFKPDFDPVLLLGQNYFAHLCMLRRDLVTQVGGWRVGFEGSQDWDLVLRVSELLEPAQVVHVPHVLYHWRSHPGSTAASLSAKPYAADAARRAVVDHLQRTGVAARVSLIGGTGFLRVSWELPDPAPAVSVIVLPRNGSRFVRCVDSIRLRSTYPDIEIVVVDDGFDHRPLRQFIARHGGDFTVVRVEGDVSDATLRNAGARAARGQVLCFVDDDVEVLTDRWLEEMVGLLLQPGVGAVGAKLLYPGGMVQHAGIVAGIGNTIGHVHRFADRLEPGYFGRTLLAQTYSAVSGACMAVRTEAFVAAGGFDEEHFGSAFGDVDLCFRLGELGWRVAWTPLAELKHHESPDEARLKGESEVRAARDIRYLHARWAPLLADDPAYNPNLSLAHETWALAWPPRADWRRIGLPPDTAAESPALVATGTRQATDAPGNGATGLPATHRHATADLRAPTS